MNLTQKTNTQLEYKYFARKFILCKFVFLLHECLLTFGIAKINVSIGLRFLQINMRRWMNNMICCKIEKKLAIKFHFNENKPRIVRYNFFYSYFLSLAQMCMSAWIICQNWQSKWRSYELLMHIELWCLSLLHRSHWLYVSRTHGNKKQ